MDKTSKQPECCNQNCNQGRTCPLRTGKAQDQQARIVQLEALLKFADERINKLVDAQSAQAAPQASEPYAVLVFERGEEGPFDRKPVKPNSMPHLHAKRDPHYDYIELYTNPTQQGLDESKVHNKNLNAFIEFANQIDFAKPRTASLKRKFIIDTRDAILGMYRDLNAAPQAVRQEPWCPDVCPITGRKFFMWLEHWETGKDVPTYGGPYDSYTIPVKDSDGTFSCERYDHDAGEWMTEGMGWECVGLKLCDDQAFIVEPSDQRYMEIEHFATHPTQQGLDGEYQRGYQDGYNRRDAEVKGALV